MKYAIELKGYSFKYDESENYILKDCDFCLEYGELCVLSGISGEGKTTLLSSINGIIPNNIPGVQEGEIFVDGRKVNGEKMHTLAKTVGSVLQNADSQIFHSKVCDELAFGCENLNFAPEAIKSNVCGICELMGLSPDEGTRTLSGGQKQRLITGSTLAMKQRILLLDEPLANLDTASSLHLLRLLKNLTSDGYAVLLVEHRLDLVLPYADRVLALQGGKLLEQDKDAMRYGNMQKVSSFCMPFGGNETVMSIRDLSYRIKGRSILDGLSLQLHKGERIVILGENGCGKTTLLRLIAGLIKPSSGIISSTFAVKTASKAWFKKVGYVYQEPSYQLFMPSVSQELGYGVTEELRNKCIKDFGLGELSERHPQSLSEGQKRRVSIAAVSAKSPEILLLDEPTVGQDFGNLENMVKTLNHIHEITQNTIVTITHDFRCAEALADRVVWIKNGKVYKDSGKDLIEEYFESSLV